MDDAGGKLLRQFAVRKPCANCPFRADGGAIDLQAGRREQILGDLLSQRASTFHCHKTVYRSDDRNFDDEGDFKPQDVAHCAGAAAVVQKLNRDMQSVQLAIRLGVIPEDHYADAHTETLGPADIDWDHLERGDRCRM